MDDDQLLDHQREADRYQDVERVRQLVDAAQQHRLGQRRECGDDHCCHGHGNPEAEAALHHVVSEIRPEQIERAMSEVHELKQAEDNAQAHGKQKIEHAEPDAVEHLK